MRLFSLNQRCDPVSSPRDPGQPLGSTSLMVASFAPPILGGSCQRSSQLQGTRRTCSAIRDSFRAGQASRPQRSPCITPPPGAFSPAGPVLFRNFTMGSPSMGNMRTRRNQLNRLLSVNGPRLGLRSPTAGSSCVSPSLSTPSTNGNPAVPTRPPLHHQQITRHNFRAALPEVELALRGCSFFAWDLEFSGLKVRRR